jgi:hypothetical protein
MIAAEIYRELYAAVYGRNAMNEATVRQWWRMFKDGQTNVHDQERSGQPSVVTDDLVQIVDKNLWKTALHNFRTLVWIITKFTYCSLRDYHRYARLSQV